MIFCWGSWLINILTLLRVKSKITLLVLVLFCQISFGQETAEKLIHGKIITELGNVAGVNIVNLVNEKSAVSDVNGEFFILAKADDLLVFSSTNLEYYRRIIEERDFKNAVLVIKMISKITQLDEVVVHNYPEINAVDLGISPPGMLHRTQMERKQYSASSSPVDALLNIMSGRTAMIDKELEVEKKNFSLEALDAIFERPFYVQTLKIPEDFVKGFQYYCIEDLNFTTVLETKNKTKIEFMLGELAVKYIDIIAKESK